MNKEEIKFPAEYEVYWSTGPVPCCDKHAQALIRLGSMLGQNVPFAELGDEQKECTNCVNENKKGI